MPSELPEENDGRLRDFYTAFFKLFRKMPDEIGRQRPSNVFFILNSFEEGETIVPDDLKMFYGM